MVCVFVKKFLGQLILWHHLLLTQWRIQYLDL